MDTVEIGDSCPVCGSKLTEDAGSCSVCNTVFEETEQVCPLCSAVLTDADEKCPGCGATLEDMPDAEEEIEVETPTEEEPEVIAEEPVEAHSPEEIPPEEPVGEEVSEEEVVIEPEEPITEEVPEEEVVVEAEEPITEEVPEEEEVVEVTEEPVPEEEVVVEVPITDEAPDGEVVAEESEEPVPEDAPEEELDIEVSEEPIADEVPEEETVVEVSEEPVTEDVPEGEAEIEITDETVVEEVPEEKVEDEEPDVPVYAAISEEDFESAPVLEDYPDDSVPMPDFDEEELEDEKDRLVEKELEELVKLKGIGPLKAKILYDSGFTDLRALKHATVVELMKIRGIGRKAAGEIKSELQHIDLMEVKQHELKAEDVDTEFQCPLCATITSAFESSCYECGTIFETDVEEGEDSDRLALSYYDSKLLRTPDNHDLWYARGATLMKMEDFNLALKSFDRALEINPEFQTAWVSKAEVYNRLGDPIKAAECYGHIISKSMPAQTDEEIEAGLAPTQIEVTAEDVKDFEAELDDVKPTEEVTPTPEETEEPAPVEAVEAPEPVDEPIEEPAPEPEVAAAEPEPEIDVQPVEPVEESLEESEPEVAEAEPEIEEQTLEPIVDDGPESLPVPVVVTPVMEIKMDYVKPGEEDKMIGMSDKQLKKQLSKRAAYVKPLLLMAKEADIDITHGKRLIAKGVSESKKGDMMQAITLLGQGIEVIESHYRAKVSVDITTLADNVRELKTSGIDVTKAVHLITSANEKLVNSEFNEALEDMKSCLDLIEKMRSG